MFLISCTPWIAEKFRILASTAKGHELIDIIAIQATAKCRLEHYSYNTLTYYLFENRKKKKSGDYSILSNLLYNHWEG